MKYSKLVALAVAAAFGLSVSAMAQGRGGGHAMGGPPSGVGPGMGGQEGPGMGGSMGQMGQAGQSERGQMGQSSQTGSQSGPRSASEMLTNNSKLSSHLAKVLGVTPTTLASDASGFKNLGLFIATMRLSKNLNIPFDQLSAAVQKDGNLGKAIQSTDPNLSKSQVKNAVRTANRQAKQDIRKSKG